MPDQTTPADGDLRDLCGASMPGAFVGTMVGPCILRHDHDGPVHQDADGAKWTLPVLPADGDPQQRFLSSRERMADNVGLALLKAANDFGEGDQIAGNLYVLRDAVMAVVSPEVERLRADLEDARVELTTAQGQVADYRATLKRSTEEHQATVERLRERWESSQRHAGQLIDRAERAEAERDAMAALMERMPDTHARFGVVGSDEPPRCADWCDVCRRERIEAERDAQRQRAEQAEKLLRDAASALDDLGACDVADCDEPACSRILQRIHVALNAASKEITDAQ